MSLINYKFKNKVTNKIKYILLKINIIISKLEEEKKKNKVIQIVS